MALLIVLILLVVTTLTASVAMRSAITHEKVINNLRVEFNAQTHAELALRYCEEQLLEAPTFRVAEFQNVENQPVRTLSALKWTDYPTWETARAGAPNGVTYYSLPSAWVDGARAPECLVERLSVAGTNHPAWVVTARGFSTDYREDANTGRIQSGSVVWLQSFLHIH